MCCFRKNKRNKKKCSDTNTATLQTAQSTNTHTVETTGGRKQALLLTNRTGSTGKTSRPKVGDVHKKILTIEENHQISAKQMEEAMQMLGVSTVNTTILQRLEKASKEVCEKSQLSTRQGDIAFTLAKANQRKPKKDDDTLYPLHKQDSENNNSKHKNAHEEVDEKEIELITEDQNDEPNSENYMWNTREIRYTCVEMFRHLDKNILIEATGDPCGDEDIEKIEWDPFAPLHVLENRPIFDCHTLRKNTFLSTALCCSTKDEQKAAKTKPKTSMPKKVKVHEPSRQLTRLRAEYSVRTNCTVNSDSLDRTVLTQEETPFEKSKK